MGHPIPCGGRGGLRFAFVFGALLFAVAVGTLRAQEAPAVPEKKIFSGMLSELDTGAMTFSVQWRDKVQNFRFDGATAVKDPEFLDIRMDDIPLGTLVVVYLSTDDPDYARQVCVRNPE